MAEKTDASRGQKRAKKRKFVSRNKPNKRARYGDKPWDVDLTKGHAIILASSQPYKEGICQRELELAFNECLEELLKDNKTKDNITTTTTANTIDSNNNNDNENNEKIDKEKEKDKEKNKENDKEKDDQEEKMEKEKEKEKEENDEDDEDDEDDNENDNKNDNEEDNDEVKGNTKSNKNSIIDFSSEIQKEIQNYDNDKKIQWIRAPPGLVVLHIKENIVDPVQFIHFIFEKTYPEKPQLSPHATKLFPLQKTCRSTHEEIVKTSKQMIEQYWKNIPLEHTFAIVYKNRCNSHLDREKLIKEIAELVPVGHKVNLKHSNVVILIQTFHNTAGVSIITEGNYRKYNEYALTENTSKK